MMNSQKQELMTTEQAARYLRIPELAIGQILHDGKITLAHSGFNFYKNDIDKLMANEKEYLESLR